MKNIKRNLVVMALFGVLVLTLSSCGKKEQNEEIRKVIAALDDDALFAIIETKAKRPVLLVTDTFYDSGNGYQASISCDVYYPIDGEAQKIGSLQSMGTAYPIAFDKTGMYAGDGHTVLRYEIDKEGNLILAEGIYETFDEEGNASYTKEKDGEATESTEEEYLSMVDAYGKAEIVNFKYGAS